MWGIVVVNDMLYMVFEYSGVFGGMGYDVIYYV